MYPELSLMSMPFKLWSEQKLIHMHQSVGVPIRCADAKGLRVYIQMRQCIGMPRGIQYSRDSFEFLSAVASALEVASSNVR